MQVWKRIAEDGRYRRFDWTLKMDRLLPCLLAISTYWTSRREEDPETAFHPDRLRDILHGT